MKPILEIKDVGKKFKIHHEQKPYLSLRDSFTDFFKRKNSNDEEFWALKDINFNVMPGESIGILGKNGAGKSTLLKILSKITPPTTGKIISRGRIASLLEVGTGFHPELTGKENIFLNGSILGMKKNEIEKNFDAIVDFSGVERFLDTPLKHYSSGMQLRLAFAVAAFLENEILVIDEVLAVGDAEFQKKCMKKMEDVSQNQGRTVLFVSHNMTAINALCSKSILLKKGSISKIGTTQEVVSYYLSTDNLITSSMHWTPENAPGDEYAKLFSIRLINENYEEIKSSDISQKIGIEFVFEIIKKGTPKLPNLHLHTIRGECVFVCAEKEITILKESGKFKSISWIPANLLNVDTYTIGVALSTMSPVKVHFWVPDAIIFETFEDLTKRTNAYNQSMPGIIRPAIEWETT